MVQRAVLAALAIVFSVLTARPAPAAPRAGHERRAAHVSMAAEGNGTLIAVTYRTGRGEHVRFLHARTPIERVAVADIDNDGDLDVVAAPHEGALLLWRNGGHGRFYLAAAAPHARLDPRRTRFERIREDDDSGVWGDLRYDAAMPRAPAAAVAVPVSIVGSTPFFVYRSSSGRHSSGRAPPAA